MKMIRFTQTFWHCPHGAAVPQFEAGKNYPADDEEARRCVARGIAEEVDVEDSQQDATTDATALSTTDLAALTTDQISALGTADVGALTTEALQSLTTADATALTTSQVAALTPATTGKKK